MVDSTVGLITEYPVQPAVLVALLERVAGKQLDQTRAKEVLDQLLESADVVMHNMRYQAAVKLGIDYDTLRAIKPSLIYVDNTAPREIQASAQGFITLVTYGVGMLIGNWISGPIVDMYARTAGDAVVHDWTAIWLWPAAMSFVAWCRSTPGGAAIQCTRIRSSYRSTDRVPGVRVMLLASSIWPRSDSTAKCV